MPKSNDFSTSTRIGLGDDLLNRIREKKFCVVGCGAVGVAFAEMLVRTGAQEIYLTDGDKVELKNLNRLTGFYEQDVGKHKVEILERNLKGINPEIKITTQRCHLREKNPGDTRGQPARDLIAKSDLVIIAIDNNKGRIMCEKLCRNCSKVDYLSIGVEVDQPKNLIRFECTWKPETPKENKSREGYGPGNGSFASIVLEAASAGFHLMLHHLQNPSSTKYSYYYKSYDCFFPVSEKP